MENINQVKLNLLNQQKMSTDTWLFTQFVGRMNWSRNRLFILNHKSALTLDKISQVSEQSTAHSSKQYAQKPTQRDQKVKNVKIQKKSIRAGRAVLVRETF